MATSASRQNYIAANAEAAMEQMRKYGIPASITLAQGIIESASGQSTLAQTANNHFGVKGTFNGAYVLANDDKPNEKFKKYDNVAQSYEDHSKVLMSSRYQKHTNGLAQDDYKGWAQAIQEGGYATASNYVATIVSVIESNNLQQYDRMVMEQVKKGGRYSMPLDRKDMLLITSPYGKREDPINKGQTQIHHGIDLRAQNNSILATENGGKVIDVNHSTNSGGGKSLTIEYSSEDGTKTRVQYMHLSQIDVKVGDAVGAGQKLGVTGNTGTQSIGEHLHFGVIHVDKEGKQ